MSTLLYYSNNANSFASATLSVEFAAIQNRFLSYLPPNSYILDLGCGSGRDSKYFLEHGHRVQAVDGCKELCCFASQYTGLSVKQLLFKDMDFKDEFDGIWACASILHVPKNEIHDTFNRVSISLKYCGIFYVSFKYGHFEGMRNGRFFTDLNEESFCELKKAIPSLRIVDLWVSEDVRKCRNHEKWLNVIMRKS